MFIPLSTSGFVEPVPKCTHSKTSPTRYKSSKENLASSAASTHAKPIAANLFKGSDPA